jgi:hypothetical protein
MAIAIKVRRRGGMTSMVRLIDPDWAIYGDALQCGEPCEVRRP